MFISQAYKAKHEWWRYVVGVMLVVIAAVIGQIPFTAALFLEGGVEILSMTEAEMLRVLDSNWSFFLLLLSFAVGLAGLLLEIRLGWWGNPSKQFFLPVLPVIHPGHQKKGIWDIPQSQESPHQILPVDQRRPLKSNWSGKPSSQQ